MDDKKLPFFFVPQVEELARKALPDDKDCNCRGKLQVTITAITPLHFGAGQLGYDAKASRFVNRLNRENGRIALPGSSCKGMLRSVFEAVSESCMPLTESCADINRRERAKENLCCPACAMFGFLGYKGKLRFSSFLAEGATETLALPQLYSHNPYGNQRRFYRHSTAYREIADRAKNEERYECLSPKAVLRGTIVYQNLTEDQLGGLLFALGLGWGDPIYHKLGYAKPAYLGSVRLEVAPTQELEQELDLEALATAYYDRHRDKIGGAVKAIKEAWSDIGDEPFWDLTKLTY